MNPVRDVRDNEKSFFMYVGDNRKPREGNREPGYHRTWKRLRY